jgi:hypothetical protein
MVCISIDTGTGAQCPRGQNARRAIVEIKQRKVGNRKVDQDLFPSASLCFGRHVKVVVPAAFAVFRTHQSALSLCGV